MNATRESEAAHSDLCDQYEQQREALADHLASVRWDNAATRMDRRKFWLQRADAVLTVLRTRTVAQVKAEGVREAAAAWDATHQTFLGGNPQTWLNARADQLERKDGRDRRSEKLERKLERVTADIRRHAGRNLPFELEREDQR